ncbi:hypothetical protein BDM02DRAFT_3193048 [Thelephora ganbajun]|uniref:Uncharacterized protein n=1 Tax=Thelephora ganbajun TaxID=370292 RepID=A0ACB6YZ97_THEGA|nr:hypothetical protein BDM02DRAFT_3193048 [Thelephora ganbajun]
MTLVNNCTFVSPRNQKITRLDSHPHCKFGHPTKDSYGFEYPTMSSLVNAVISQVDNDFPRHQFANGCSFDDIVLFDLVLSGLVDHQEFDEPHKWSSRNIRYSAVVADRLWSLYEAERRRNDRVEANLQVLKGQVSLLNNRLLMVDRFSFDANKKVNMELEKDGDKHNVLVSFVGGHSSQLELHCRGLLSLRDKMCSCAAPESPIDGSGAAPSFSSPSTPRGGSPAVEVESEESVVVPPENEVPVPVPAPVIAIPAPTPRRTVVESTSTLRPISEDEARAIEDRLVGAWQQQGVDNAIPITLDGSELNETSDRSCGGCVVELTQDQMGIRSPEARGYRMLSVMRAVTMMPNSTVSARLLSSDFVGGELQLVFPISQEEFDSLASGEMEAEVQLIVTTEVVRGGVEDDELEYE